MPLLPRRGRSLRTSPLAYDEVTIPHGFDSTPGALGSHQTITVPANSSNDYKMQNDEWSVKVSIDKIDSETKQRIKGDAEFKIFEWDVVRQCYIPTGGYNQYKVERQSRTALIRSSTTATMRAVRMIYSTPSATRASLSSWKAARPAGTTAIGRM